MQVQADIDSLDGKNDPVLGKRRLEKQTKWARGLHGKDVKLFVPVLEDHHFTVLVFVISTKDPGLLF